MQQLILSSEQSSHESSGRDQRIGPFCFEHPPPRSIRRTLKVLYKNYNSNTTALNLGNGRLEELIPEEALKVAVRYEIGTLSSLTLTNNKMVGTSILLKCHFDNLSMLNLSRNRLSSLQDIAQNIQFPMLEELILCNNQFTTLKGFPKLQLPLLQTLSLELNYLCSLEQIPYAYLPALLILNLYGNNLADLRPILKLQSRKIQTLTLYNNPSSFGPQSSFRSRFQYLQTLST